MDERRIIHMSPPRSSNQVNPPLETEKESQEPR
jgi:hypothetical protein